jgi:hypothetical protein
VKNQATRVIKDDDLVKSQQKDGFDRGGVRADAHVRARVARPCQEVEAQISVRSAGSAIIFFQGVWPSQLISKKGETHEGHAQPVPKSAFFRFHFVALRRVGRGAAQQITGNGHGFQRCAG